MMETNNAEQQEILEQESISCASIEANASDAAIDLTIESDDDDSAPNEEGSKKSASPVTVVSTTVPPTVDHLEEPSQSRTDETEPPPLPAVPLPPVNLEWNTSQPDSQWNMRFNLAYARHTLGVRGVHPSYSDMYIEQEIPEILKIGKFVPDQRLSRAIESPEQRRFVKMLPLTMHDYLSYSCLLSHLAGKNLVAMIDLPASSCLEYFFVKAIDLNNCDFFESFADDLDFIANGSDYLMGIIFWKPERRDEDADLAKAIALSMVSVTVVDRWTGGLGQRGGGFPARV